MLVIKKVFVILLICKLSVSVLGKSKLPSFIKVCAKSDPNIKKCLIESVEKLRPFMAKGIPQFGIPSCEPLIIPEVFIDQGNGPVSLKSSFRDIQVFGPTKFKVENIKIDLDKDKWKIKLYFPDLSVNTNYTMKGKIMMMDISGTGQSYGNYSDIDATMTMKAQRTEKEGDVYYNIQDCKVDFNIGNAQIRFDDLFNGNQELGDAMNLFLNDNWQSVATELKPVLEHEFAELFKKFANKIFHKYPIKVLFPE